MNRIHNQATVSAVNLDPLICAVLRHAHFPWDDAGDPTLSRRFVEAASLHGVLPLLDAEFRARSESAAWPREILMACLTSTLARGAYEHAHLPEIVHVIDALAADGVQPLVLKGTALAYGIYPRPELRPRNDTDLLIAVEQRAQACRTLRRIGYSRAQGVSGEFISYQSLWTRSDASGIHHRVDVHWRINNSQLLAKTLTYPELARRGAPLPALGASARALALADSLLLACLHRVGHVDEIARVGDTVRRGSDRLIWLYDIHLLAGRMSDADLEAFAALAAQKRVGAICLDALRRTGECFGAAVGPRVLQALSAPGLSEPSAVLLQPADWRHLAGDFLAIDGWRDRIRWLGELAFPPAEYMRWRYRDGGARWLPWLYLRRALLGAARRLAARRDGA